MIGITINSSHLLTYLQFLTFLLMIITCEIMSRFEKFLIFLLWKRYCLWFAKYQLFFNYFDRSNSIQLYRRSKTLYVFIWFLRAIFILYLHTFFNWFSSVIGTSCRLKSTFNRTYEIYIFVLEYYIVNWITVKKDPLATRPLPLTCVILWWIYSNMRIGRIGYLYGLCLRVFLIDYWWRLFLQDKNMRLSWLFR